jgi:glycosyltransferase involved in cell wall biosynthesis
MTTSTNRAPKILIIGPTPPPYNGMSVVTSNILHSSLAERFELVLLDTADRRSLSNVGRLDWRNVVLALTHGLTFLSQMLRTRPSMVYVPIAQGTLGYLRDCLFLIPARLLGCKVIVHLLGSAFGSFYHGASRPMRFLIRWTLRKARRAIVLGQNVRSACAGLVPEERVVVIPNGIESDATNTESRRSVEQTDGCCRIVYLGTLMKAKGFMEVLRSVPLVVSQEPSARFVLAGQHFCAEEMREAYDLIQNHNLHRVVSMPGVLVQNEKKRLLESADVFVFPPVAPEGQPLVILEAMSAGLPVIATPQGAISETVEDGVTGFIVPPEDPAAIADKILLLLQNHDLRHQMGQASRKRFLERYTLDRWADDMQRVFQDVLDES